MKFRVVPPILAFLAFAALATPESHADVIVVSNRTRQLVKFTVMPLGTKARQYQLASGDLVPIATEGKLPISFFSGPKEVRYQLDANSAYYFGGTRDGQLDLQKIGLGGDEQTASGRKLPGSNELNPVATITVKILVDEDEHFRRELWEERLRRRVQEASKILQKYCRVRLKVVAVETWKSDDRITEFPKSLAELEKEVDPAPAQLAIGFTSQYQLSLKGKHLGGVYGPLRRHVLVREWSTHISERERLEVLVHELGHILGAAHSPEPNSVMRPVLGDRKARNERFSIRFDPVNTLAMYMIGEELRRRSITKFRELSPETKERLAQIYRELVRANPDDPTAKRYLQMSSGRNTKSSKPLTLDQATRRVVQQVVRAARTNIRLPVAGGSGSRGPRRIRRKGDALTEYYVRQAALAAAAMPPEIGPAALMLGLGIALDDSKTLLSNPLTRNFAGKVERSAERKQRLKLLRKPTMRGRRDLASHFFVSAYLTSALGHQAAGAAGLTKEMSDAHGGSGFSFVDMAANQAGILFAQGVLRGKFPLMQLAKGFSVADFLPKLDDLEEGLSSEKFNEQYGGNNSNRYQQAIEQIRRRIQALPPYQPRRQAAR